MLNIIRFLANEQFERLMPEQKKCILAFLHVSVQAIVRETRAGSTVFQNANTFSTTRSIS